MARVWKKYGVKAIRYSIIPVFAIITIFGIIYNGSGVGHNLWIWMFMKILTLVFILGFGAFGLLGHLTELRSATKLRKKLGISAEKFKALIEAYQITGY